ncbi:MAG: bifunctional diaminohydroxyphosphoribosylaminopyrimidine deaminase/5-amino-6-(5-phosphoribosylamino)uracil reductase RibD [Sphingomonadales bacterium]|nr:bifunctional diaminohydroxyphosphoribosylaminopyrimidine deaminase/5-amino-6-(5-phosphoribosylamino)uracil reductase RibD [Sphingomonadales bacterium]
MGIQQPMPPVHQDFLWMRRCLEIARIPGSSVSPNPLVGALIVQNHKIIGQGAHLRWGSAHAEIHALQQWRSNRLSHNSAANGEGMPTLYISLEPCNHQGKTPPCTEAIIDAGIQSVVFGCNDPHPLVSGAGINRLLQAGIMVRGPVLEKECRWMNRRFETACRRNRPYVILKWAMSADGFLDNGEPGPGPRISGPLASLITHQLRREQAAIMVGAQTLIKDDPDLRAWRLGDPHPRVVIASDGRSMDGPYRAFARIPEPLVLFWPQPCRAEDLVKAWCDTLMEQRLNSLLVEGGRKTLDIFLNSGIWDEIHIFQNQELNLHHGTPAPYPPCDPIREEKVGKDTYRIYLKGFFDVHE